MDDARSIACNAAKRYIGAICCLCLLGIGGCASDADIRLIWDKNGGSILQISEKSVIVRFDGSRKSLTDDDVKQLAPALDRIGATNVSFGNNQRYVTDVSLGYLVNVDSIERLVLVGTGVTLDGLATLKRMPNLSVVIVRNDIADAEAFEVARHKVAADHSCQGSSRSRLASHVMNPIGMGETKSPPVVARFMFAAGSAWM